MIQYLTDKNKPGLKAGFETTERFLLGAVSGADCTFIETPRVDA